jgi:hypothetical protein
VPVLAAVKRRQARYNLAPQDVHLCIHLHRRAHLQLPYPGKLPDGSGVEPWDTEWAAAKAAEALRYLGPNFPEYQENLRVLDGQETAAYEAAMRGDRSAYMVPLYYPCT